MDVCSKILLYTMYSTDKSRFNIGSSSKPRILMYAVWLVEEQVVGLGCNTQIIKKAWNLSEPIFISSPSEENIFILYQIQTLWRMDQ